MHQISKVLSNRFWPRCLKETKPKCYCPTKVVAARQYALMCAILCIYHFHVIRRESLVVQECLSGIGSILRESEHK